MARPWRNFDRAVPAEMDDYDAYRAFIWGLRPRWLGSYAEMLQFGDECLKTRRFDTCVPNYYFKVVNDIASEEPDPKEVYQRAEISHNLLNALNSYFSTPSMPLVPTYAHTMAAVLEYRWGNFSSARAHMDAIQLQPNAKIGNDGIRTSSR